ncbi:MAG: helix-turn-helix domain-containing protein [Nostocaceae cyanobacterium]|nr:helix-turn-helix domain-containing protein [Nostocaceae cyanobacterium]
MSQDYSKSDIGEKDSPVVGKYLTAFQRKMLQKRLEADLSHKYRQRLQIMLLADEGKTQGEICKALGCSPHTARHWILMAQHGEAHNWQSNPIGRPKAVNDEYLQRLQELVSNSPKEFGYPFQRWTAQWLGKHLAKEFGIEIAPRHINRLLKQMGLSTKPKSAQAEETIKASDGIVIGNLNSSNLPEYSELWIFNPSKLG